MSEGWLLQARPERGLRVYKPACRLVSVISSKEESMSRNFVKTLIALGAAIFFSVAIALADKGKTVSIFYDTILPNGQELKAGDYAVHMSETAKEVQFIQKGKVIAAAPCNCVEKQKKNRRTEVVYTKTSEGKQVIQELRLSGDTKTIVLEAQGM